MLLRNTKKKEDPSLIKDENNKAYDIPLEGSLGLLASGYKGIMMWRQKRSEYGKTLPQKTNIPNP